jgi:hypothetical protein
MFKLWTIYCEDNDFPGKPLLPSQMDTERINIMVAFTAQCRTVVWGQGNQIQVGTVVATVRHIRHTFEPGGYSNPRNGGTYGSTYLYLALSHLYHGY